MAPVTTLEPTTKKHETGLLSKNRIMMSFKILFKLPQYNSVIHKLLQSFQQSMKELYMVKKQKLKYAGAPLAPPQPTLFDNVEKGDELSRL